MPSLLTNVSNEKNLAQRWNARRLASLNGTVRARAIDESEGVAAILRAAAGGRQGRAAPNPVDPRGRRVANGPGSPETDSIRMRRKGRRSTLVRLQGSRFRCASSARPPL